MLYFVATPIGNLEDITLRALRVLREADAVAAEDTRRAIKLLNHYDIKKPLISLYRENERQRAAELTARARNEAIAVVTDAGMPLISDPGEYLLGEAVRKGVEITIIPGPSAALTALALSALPTGRFAFEGFLPRETKPLKERLDRLLCEERTMIFYESPLRLKKTLSAIQSALGERRAAVLRELTKLHEEAARGALSELIARYDAPPKGECVIVVEGAPPDSGKAALGDAALKEKLAEALALGLSRSDAVKKLAKELGVPRNALYKLTLDE